MDSRLGFLRDVRRFPEALIFHTAKEWIECLATHLPMRDPPIVNFWSSDLNTYRLGSGSPFLFKKAGSGMMVGLGAFKRKLNMTIREAWQEYDYLNGVETLEKFLSRASGVLGMRNPGPHSKIGCFEIYDARFAEQYRWVPLADYEISNRIRCKYIRFEMAEEIIRKLGFVWDLGPFVIR